MNLPSAKLPDLRIFNFNKHRTKIGSIIEGDINSFSLPWVGAVHQKTCCNGGTSVGNVHPTNHGQELGLREHLIFCGWVRNIPMIYADIDILALTSLNEGTPVSIIEAMASSIPVIATDAGEVPDLLGIPVNVSQSNGVTVCERGILCRNDDVSGFSNGLKYLAENGISQKEGCIKRARVFVKQRYSQERLLNDMETTYLNLMEKVPAKNKYLLLQQKCVH